MKDKIFWRLFEKKGFLSFLLKVVGFKAHLCCFMIDTNGETLVKSYELLWFNKSIHRVGC